MNDIKKIENEKRTMNILFVCNGNVFRSYSAECLLKHYLKQNEILGWEVSSAGTKANKADVDPEVIAQLEARGIKKEHHVQHKLNKTILENADLVIAMAEDQINFIADNFNSNNVYLFNELAKGEKSSIWDVENEVINYMANRNAVEEKIDTTIKYIGDNIPALVEGIKKCKTSKYYIN